MGGTSGNEAEAAKSSQVEHSDERFSVWTNEVSFWTRNLGACSPNGWPVGTGFERDGSVGTDLEQRTLVAMAMALSGGDDFGAIMALATVTAMHYCGSEVDMGTF